MKIITWDYKEQPPIDEINRALREHSNCPQLAEVETFSDQFAIVVHESGETGNPQAYYNERRNG